MSETVEVQVEFDGLGALREAWTSFISHGALMTQAYPPPAIGAAVTACVQLKGGEAAARLEGEVLQSSAAATIINLAPLTDEVRIALAQLGLGEADPEGLAASAEAKAEVSEPPAKPVKQPAAEQEAPSSSSLRPITQSSEPEPSAGKKAAGSKRRAGGAGGKLEWAFHLSGRELRQREGELPEATLRGEVGESSWRDSLIGFFLESSSGVVVIHGFREDRWLFLSEGQPVHYVLQKAHPGEHLLDILLGDETITREEWQAESDAGSDLAIAERLVEVGKLTKDQLESGLHRRTVALTRNLVRANFGEWSFHPTGAPTKRAYWPSVMVLEVLLDSERRVVGQRSDEEIVRETEPVLAYHVTVAEGRGAVLSALPLMARERVVADDLLPGGWTIKELFVYSGLLEQELLRFLLVLKSLGTIILLESEGEKSKRNRAERALYVGLRDITRRPDFEAIHCHWTAIEEEINLGYQKVLDEFNAERFAEVSDERILGLIRRIEERAEELYGRLKTKAGRDSVRRSFIGPSQMIMASDLMNKQGDMAAYKGRLDLARVCYLRVLELSTKGPECLEAVRNAQSQLRKDPIRNAKSSGMNYLADVVDAVDKFLADG